MRNADYIIKRTLFAIVTVFVALTINFLLFRALPGSAVSGLRCAHCTKQFRESIVKQYGLDQPTWRQYVIYLENLAHGDLGTSVANNRPVWDVIKQPLLNTLPMLLVGTIISVVLGIISGVIAAWRRSTWLDAGNTWTALSFYAMPTQWIGLLVIFYIAIPLGLPVAGIQSNDLGILGPVSLYTEVVNRGQHLALPALVLGLGLYGEYALVVRSSMLETLGEDYVLTARAKGLKNRVIVWRHAFRNAMLPLVTLIALSLGLCRGRPDRGRVRVLVSRHRSCHRRCHQRPRLPGTAGHLPDLHDHRDRGELHRRPSVLQPRSKGESMSDGAFPIAPDAQLDEIEPTSTHRSGFFRDVVLGSKVSIAGAHHHRVLHVRGGLSEPTGAVQPARAGRAAVRGAELGPLAGHR